MLSPAGGPRSSPAPRGRGIPAADDRGGQGGGFTTTTEGASAVANPGGEFPVNTSGGLLSEAYQMGFNSLTEGVVQLQGNAGERQLGPATQTNEPEIIMVSNNGGILQTHSTVILRR